MGHVTIGYGAAKGVKLALEDYDHIRRLLGDEWRAPDLTIAPDGKPYIHRWHLIPRNEVGANVYLHLQVASDPERPLHDHPWDNTSVILAGGYVEVLEDQTQPRRSLVRRTGQVIHRRAEEAHRILLPDHIPYTISLFTTGPVVRDWGFWTEQGWLSHHVVTETLEDGTSVYTGPHS